MPHHTAVTDSLPDFSGRVLDDGRLKLIEPLGSGAYGKVYKAIELKSPSDKPGFFAVKCLLKPKPGSRQEDYQTREFALHQLVSSHPNIVSFRKVISDRSYVYVVLDLCSGGDLFAAITEKQLFYKNDELIKAVFVQILDAVHYCHENRVFHRDLKPENILCCKDGGQVYLADFGLSTQDRISQDFGCGSSYYMSPECIGKEFKHEKYSTCHSDIWSLGVILTNMIAGRNPWRYAMTTDDCFSAFLDDRDFLRAVLPISQDANRILKQIFQLNPLCRISIPKLRLEILKIETFFMSDEELSTSSHVVQAAAKHYAAPTPKPEPEPAREIGKPRVSSNELASEDSLHSSLDSEEVYLYASPAEGLQPLCSHPHNALLDTFSIGSNPSGKSLSSSSSEPESQGPITPASKAVEPNVEVPDLPEEQIGSKMSIVTFHTAAPAVKAGKPLPLPRHRAPSNAAPIPPPRRVGNQLFKRAIQRFKALSENVSS